MTKFWCIFILALFLIGSAAHAKEHIVSHTPTGDPDLDRSLSDLNDGVKDNVREFARRLSRHYHIPEETTDWLLDKVGMSPGDAYMAAKVSKVAGKPIEEVADAYRKNKGKGWGVIAKSLGIKPGSEAFHQLKSDDSGLLKEVKEKSKKQKNKNAKGKGKGKGSKSK